MRTRTRFSEWSGNSLVFAAISAAMLVAPCARADEPTAPEIDVNPASLPPPSTQPNLVLIGAAVTAGWYGASVATSYGWRQSNEATWLRIPIVGPYVALGKTRCDSRETDCKAVNVVIRTILTSFCAIGQTGGVLAMLEGAFLRTESPRPNLLSVPEEERAHRRSRVAVVPVPVGESMSGLGVGVFGDF
jgi:hypothetical protein